MKIISTNIAKPHFVTIKGKQQRTGIFKKPTKQPIYLEKETVKGDEVSNRKVHGGEFKACYLFSADNYPYWKSIYPNIEWHYGMLGENLTVKGLDETKIHIGDIYKVGKALVQITQPREPCNTFAAKMGTPAILKQFIAHGKPGTYVRVLEEGFVTTNDTFKLIEKAKSSLTTSDFFNLLFANEKNQEHLKRAIVNNALPERKKAKLIAYLK
jgi:MOSC domain-containing protein YiiM